MPLNLALNTALSGLLASQQVLDVISNNLANIDNPNYTDETANLEEVTLAGQGVGVEVSSITQDINNALDTSLQSAQGTLDGLTTTQQYDTSIQNMFGQPGSGASLGDLIQTLDNSLETLSSAADQTPSLVIEAAQAVTSELQSMSQQIQSLRTQADQSIQQDVGQVNSILGNIQQLNSEISTDSVSGIDVSGLEDQRSAALSQLATYINFTTYTRSDGSIAIYTQSGTPLLDGQADTLSHTAASQIGAQMTYAGGQLQGIDISGPDVVDQGEDIASQFSSGDIASLMQLRDSTLPNLQSQLDTLAQTLQNGLNQINNQGTSYPDGGQSYTGTTTFLDPNSQSISLSGGDTAVVLLNSDGTQQASSTLSLIMEQYLQSQNLPTTNSWTISQVAAGLNGWLNQQFSTTGVTYASITSSGNFSLQLPQTSSTTIAFRDEQTSTFQSGISADPTEALGLTGALTLRDSAGNVYSVNVTASDSLTDIENEFNALGGLTATLVPNSDGSGDYLQVVNNAGNDMTVDPDATGADAQSGLEFLPSGSNAATNVTVNYNEDSLGTSWTSSEFASANTVPGVAGVLTFQDSTGVLANVALTPGMTLQTIANAINAAGKGKLNATIQTVGNQVELNVADVAGNQMSVTGANDPVYQSTTSLISSPFVSAAGSTLSVAVGSGAANTINVAGMTLQQIAATVNSNSLLQSAGVVAAVENDGTNQWLDIYNSSGQQLTIGGTLVGSGTGQIASFADNPATESDPDPASGLGLQPPADETVAGFANFLGLNDLLVTNQQITSYQSQTLTSTYALPQATALELSDSSFANGNPITGAQASLNISFKAGETLQQVAAQINAQAVTYNSAQVLDSGFSASPGILTISSNPSTLGTVAIDGGMSLQQIAQAIDSNASLSAAGVQAVVGTDGTSEWLQVYSQQGQPLQLSETMGNGQEAQLQFVTNQLASAAVVSDGSGVRLQITHNNTTAMQATGGITSQLGLSAAATGTAASLQVQSDIAANASLMSRGALQYDSTDNEFYAGVADSTITTEMADFLSSPQSFSSAGGLGQGDYTLSEYAANMVSAASTSANNTQTSLTYQQTLVSSLTTQKGQVSGVNIDQELSNLIIYQQSYQASARVISTMQTLFAALDDIIQ